MYTTLNDSFHVYVEQMLSLYRQCRNAVVLDRRFAFEHFFRMKFKHTLVLGNVFK